jgi:hypothetical protein
MKYILKAVNLTAVSIFLIECNFKITKYPGEMFCLTLKIPG